MSAPVSDDLFPRLRSQRPATPTPSIPVIISFVSTVAAVVLGACLLFGGAPPSRSPTTVKGSVPSVLTAKQAPRANRVVAPAAPQADEPPKLPSPSLNLYDQPEKSEFFWDVTPSKLIAFEPSISCEPDEGVKAGTTCALETPDQVYRVCAFEQCEEELLSFNDLGDLRSILAGVGFAGWSKLREAFDKVPALTPHVSSMSMLSVRNDMTCYDLKTGTMTFIKATGFDIYGNSVKRPYSVLFTAKARCAS